MAVKTCEAVELAEAVPVEEGSSGVGDKITVDELVCVAGGFVGGGVLVLSAGVRVSVGVAVPVGRNGTSGVGVYCNESAPEGVGVNKKTPVTTGSSPDALPSSWRITLNTDGSIGATFSKGQRP